ncbi:head GIN domain-containing protein [Hymenobacter crusticola]|uniref:Putative auto-transporter adhesin head GIN domain-containing protein n=1 Tax=Hymenobacter crusticola TaxID=1770526 RepID=A0A243W8L1_9BACT|nr:head GIN domain-containing protein [Hymenobacter crusticola]OUJ71650.1 hypothetical protein BXP70_21460 [Hymenobacter crusticola]
MKTLRLLLLALLPALLLLPSFRSGRLASREVRQVSAFTELKLAGSPKVILRQGSPQKVELEGDPADLARVETNVSNGQLRIGIKNNDGHGSSDSDGGLLSRVLNSSNNVNIGPITVYVTMPEIKALSVSGSGSIKAAEAIKATTLDLAVSGSGNLSLAQLQSTAVSSAVSGSGSITVVGAAPRHDVRISGSGNVQSADLRAEASKVSISGSGNCQVNATKTLDARIAGSGSIYVTGNPQINSSIAGSGRVHRS